MSHDFMLTDEDAGTRWRNAPQYILELSMLTMQQGSSVVDVFWEESPLDQ